MHRVNPEECASRKLHTVERRQYSCPCPNYVWRIDGTHKLVRWRFIVHAEIDGFSRLVVYCHCSTNNKAATVLDLFQRAVSDYGLPLRIRSDYGVENVRVWDYMIQRRQNTNAIILGSSVHNQRIERFNRDVNYQVVNHFFNQFMHMEDIDMLDPMTENDLFCLHLTYLPEINKRLSEFRHAYNDHAISSERNFSPRQLFQLNRSLLQLQFLDPAGTINLSNISGNFMFACLQFRFLLGLFSSHSTLLLQEMRTVILSHCISHAELTCELLPRCYRKIFERLCVRSSYIDCSNVYCFLITFILCSALNTSN